MSEQSTSEILNRPPRLQSSQLKGEIDIPSPPSETDGQERSMLLTILPVASMGMMGIFYLVIASSSGGNALYALPMLLMGGVTVGVSLLTFSFQKVEQNRQFMKRRRDYNRLLDRKIQRLQAAREIQLDNNRFAFPPPDELLERVQRFDLSLWSRRPEDPDFLSVRLGMGEAESGVFVKLPDPDTFAPDLRRATDIVFDYKHVPDTAITTNLLQIGALGIIGKRVDTLKFGYSIIAQLATFHAPSEIDIYIFSSQVGYHGWDWTRWLPHTSKSGKGGYPDLIAFGVNDVRGMLDTLTRRVDARSSEESGVEDKEIIIVLFDHLNDFKDETAFKALLNSRQAGVITLCLLDEMEEVPSECKGVIELTDERFELKLTGTEAKSLHGTVDSMQRVQAELIARQLTNFTLTQAGDSGRIPARSSFLPMFEAPSLKQLNISQRWQRPVMPNGRLPFAVPLGNTGYSSHLMFDLSDHAHGPHGVVAGTTGAGKSELLQTLVSSLAVVHHPYLLNFLLIDYKGGATFNIFRNLPHTAGIITNLNVVDALRALEAIKSENRRRQIFLAEQNTEDITEYHKRLGRLGGKFPADWKPLPHLVIIIDEFAELKTDLPNFINELVATVRVGRSLGMHLILATQRPAGHVTQEMSANLNFRISLRVQSPEESREMIRLPDAAYIPPSLPGRSYFLVGNDLQEFQTAWVGMDYDESQFADEPEETPVTLRLLHAERLVKPSENTSSPRPTEQPVDENAERIPTLAEALSKHLTTSYSKMKYLPTETVFLESLADAFPLRQVLDLGNYGGWDGSAWQPTKSHEWKIPLGLIDDIPNRTQPPMEIDFPGLGGHVMVAGAPGTGKTTFLRTLAMSLANLYKPDEIEIYVLSMAGRGLDMLEILPHVVAVIRNDENERIERMFRRVLETIDSRRNLLAQVNADDLLQYNSRTVRQGGNPLRAIFVLIDNFVELQKYFQDDIDSLVAILRDSRAVGIYFAITTPSANISYKVMNVIQQRFALRLNERGDYLQFIGRLEGREVNPRPGSGLLSGKPPQHCQIALAGSGDDEDQRLEDMQRIIQAMNEAWGDRPKPASIVTLPTNVPLERVLDASPAPTKVAPNAVIIPSLQTPIGLESLRLQVQEMDWLREGPHFLINGPVGSGKSSLLRTLLLGVTSRYSPKEAQLLLLDLNQQSLQRLRRLPHVIEYIFDEDTLNEHLKQLTAEIAWRTSELQKRKEQAGDSDEPGYFFPPIIFAIDDYDQLRDALTSSYNNLTELGRSVRADTRLGIHIIVAGETNGLTSGSDRLVKQIKLMRSGFSLVSAEAVEFMGGRATRAMRNTQLPNGRGFLLTRNSSDLMQFAHQQDPTELISQISSKWAGYPRATWAHPLKEDKQPEPTPAAPKPASTSNGNKGFSADFDFDLSGALDDYKKQQSQAKKG